MDIGLLSKSCYVCLNESISLYVVNVYIICLNEWISVYVVNVDMCVSLSGYRFT